VSASKSALNNIHTIFQNYITTEQRLTLMREMNETEGHLSIAVKCSAARDVVRFRALVSNIHAQLQIGQRAHGEVCPGAWVYHFEDLRVAADDSAHERARRHLSAGAPVVNLRFTIRILQGGIFQAAVRKGQPPGFNSKNMIDLALMSGPDPQSTVAHGFAVEYHLDVCGAAEDAYFVGLFGDKSGCALYDVTAEAMDASEVCKSGAVRVEHEVY
jgi:hypothetical protein